MSSHDAQPENSDQPAPGERYGKRGRLKPRGTSITGLRPCGATSSPISYGNPLAVGGIEKATITCFLEKNHDGPHRAKLPEHLRPNVENDLWEWAR